MFEDEVILLLRIAEILFAIFHFDIIRLCINLEFFRTEPNITYKDSMVYYWRTALDSGNNTVPVWTASSFVYLPQKYGWNQSHYFQYKKDAFSTLGVDNNRHFNFKIVNNQLYVNNKVFYANDQVNDVKIMFNDVDIQRSGCPPYVAGF